MFRVEGLGQNGSDYVVASEVPVHRSFLRCVLKERGLMKETEKDVAMCASVPYGLV